MDTERIAAEADRALDEHWHNDRPGRPSRADLLALALRCALEAGDRHVGPEHLEAAVERLKARILHGRAFDPPRLGGDPPPGDELSDFGRATAAHARDTGPAISEPEFFDDFICVCGPDAAKLAAADELRESARRILEAGTDDWCPGPVADRDFLDAAVVYLNEHWAHIAEIVTDQWSLVEVIERRHNPDTNGFETTLVLRIQCDRVEDGVARAVQLIAERADGGA